MEAVVRWTTGRWRTMHRGIDVAWLSLCALKWFLLNVLALLGVFGLGAAPLWMWSAERGRRTACRARRELAEWTGTEIPDPYRPPPSPSGDHSAERPVGQPFSVRHRPEWNRRWNWMFTDPATWQDLLWLGTAPLLAAWAVLPAAAAGYGLFGLAVPDLWGWWQEGRPFSVAGVTVGLLLVPAAVVAAPWLVRLHDRGSLTLLAPTERALLAWRVRQLTDTRTEAVDIQSAELRRIERDLHDGVQARLVAMGLHLSTLESVLEQDPAAARELVVQARQSSARALTELRSLVRGIHPPVLAERGLVDAVRSEAMDSPLEVEVAAEVPGRLEAPVESAVYFAVCELLTNAAKHAQPPAPPGPSPAVDGDGPGARWGNRVWIDMQYLAEAGVLRVSVTDDGCGGADPARGSGLRGIERRLGTFDGVLALSSPRGGPTMVTMELPCVLSSPRTSTSSGTA